eukprot:11198065-Lingulodinium_polyedra.AAC.1
MARELTHASLLLGYAEPRLTMRLAATCRQLPPATERRWPWDGTVAAVATAHATSCPAVLAGQL